MLGNNNETQEESGVQEEEEEKGEESLSILITMCKTTHFQDKQTN